MNRILILIIFFISTQAYAAAPTRQFTYVSNTTIDPTQVNANENALYSYLQTGVDTYAAGSITGASISASASIPYTSLSLSGSIVNADISISAAIVGSKLDLTAPGIIGSVTPAAGTFTTLTSTSSLVSPTSHQGDIYYDNGVTGLQRLTPGTAGQVLKTLGNAANPTWVNSISGFYDYGTSSSASTIRQGTAMYVATGNTSVGSVSTQAITNLPFTSSTSYYVTCTYTSAVAVNENCLAIPSSGASFTLKNDQAAVRSIQWIAIGS